MHSLLLSLFVTNYCYFEEQPEFYLRTFFTVVRFAAVTL